MSLERLQHLLGHVGLLILNKDANLRKAIPAAERLMLAMRFLAAGDSQVSLSYLFQMGKKSLSRIISEPSEVIVQVLLQGYMSPRETEVQWKNIAQEFGDLGQFSHVIGAIDGDHVVSQFVSKL